MNTVEAYPLHWPTGRPRSKQRKIAPFHKKATATSPLGNSISAKQSLTIADSRDRVLRELGALGATAIVISSNLRLREDGLPLGQQSNPADPGVAVYFQLSKLPHSLSCDSWTRAADNLAAIAKHVEAMRGQQRWGVADVATMFAGFKALPGAIITPERMTPEDADAFLCSVLGTPRESSRILRDRDGLAS